VLLTPIPAMVDYPNHLARGEHLVDIEGVTGSIPVAPTIQSSRTAETVLDRKEAVSAGNYSTIFNVPGLCRQ
jgi:hypothetical protein